MATRLHEEVCEHVARKYNAERRGFKRQLKSLSLLHACWETNGSIFSEVDFRTLRNYWCNWVGEKIRYCPIPDAFKIYMNANEDDWWVECWEVSLSTFKEYERYEGLFWWLDNMEINLKLHTICAKTGMKGVLENLDIPWACGSFGAKHFVF